VDILQTDNEMFNDISYDIVHLIQTGIFYPVRKSIAIGFTLLFLTSDFVVSDE